MSLLSTSRCVFGRQLLGMGKYRVRGPCFAAVALVYCGVLLEISNPSVALAEPPITALCFSPQGDHLLIASQQGLRICDPARLFQSTTCEPFSMQGEIVEPVPPAIHDLQFSPNGDRVLVSGGIPAEAGTVAVLNWPVHSLLWRKEIGEDILYGSDWSPDGRFIATASFDGVCRILNHNGRLEQSLTGHSAGLTDVAWIDGGQILTGSHDTTLRLWRFSTGRLERTLNNHAGAIAGALGKPSQAGGVAPAALPLIASIADDRTVRFWQPTIGRMVRFYRFDAARPVCAAWTPDGEFLVVGTTAGQVILVDPLTASVEQSFDMTMRHTGAWVTALTVQPNGGAVIAGSSTGNVERFELPEASGTGGD